MRTGGDPRALIPAVRREVAALDQNLPLQELQPLAENVALALWSARTGAAVLSVFGLLGLVVGQGLVLTLVGSALGLALAWALTRLLASQLYGISATDLVTFAGVPLFLIVVALAACYLPARRATQVDPLAALRHE